MHDQSAQHLVRVSVLEKQVSELDRVGTDLKLKVVELELEKAACQQDNDMERKELQRKVLEQQALSLANESRWGEQVKNLQADIEDVSNSGLDT